MSSIEKKWGTELEICVDSIESAVVAAKSGATRLELCSALSEGGLTPSVGLFRAIMRLVSIPIFVLIRPRRGDFCYSDDEIQAMCDDISILKKEGAVGFVLGALTVNGSIDKPAMKRLISAARSDSGLEHPKNVSLTFHRAIDMVPDPLSCVADIIELGMDRILSSGGKSTAYEGALVLKAMVKKAGDSCIIMAGAGITADNIAYISGMQTSILSSLPSCLVQFFPASRLYEADSLLPLTNLIDQLLSYHPSLFVNNHTCILTESRTSYCQSVSWLIPAVLP